MFFSALFAVEQLKPIDPGITNFFVGAMVLFLIVALGMIAWHVAPILYTKYRNKRTEKAKAESNIWFDADKSVLHRGSRDLKIVENTLEFFICKMIFNEPSKSQSDTDILEQYGGDPFTQRPVYQAVKRLNQKTASKLELKEDLFRWSKDKTELNDNFR